ncbi:MAG: hypothetical protein EHM38_06990 [Geobacteraceae bacterium]|jgi:hypothetical protein|nr:MAG: hypothetical protein EHM38_06990 [Geobacteraceae bacterium]
MKIEYKVTTWERFDIEDKHREGLLEFLKENPKAAAMDIYNWYCDIGGDPYIEQTTNTDCEMTTDENGGCSTIEVYDDPNDEAIWWNGTNP